MHAEVDSGRKAGIVALIARRAHIAHFKAYGMAERESGTRMTRLIGQTPVDQVYRNSGIHFGRLASLKELVGDKPPTMPLLYHPAERWVYSVSHDVEADLQAARHARHRGSVNPVRSSTVDSFAEPVATRRD